MDASNVGRVHSASKKKYIELNSDWDSENDNAQSEGTYQSCLSLQLIVYNFIDKTLSSKMKVVSNVGIVNAASKIKKSKFIEFDTDCELKFKDNSDGK